MWYVEWGVSPLMINPMRRASLGYFHHAIGLPGGVTYQVRVCKWIVLLTHQLRLAVPRPPG